jgi:hypothetical protein
VLVAVAAFFSWLLLAMAAWAALVVLQREGPRRAALLAGACALAVLALNAALAAFTGYDPIGALHSTEAVYRNSLARVRPYAFWAFGSPTAWLVMLGLPTAWLALRSLGRRDQVALALGAVILAAAVLGFTKAETERIWLFLAPLVCLAAAPLVRRHRTLAAALALQALVYGALMDSVW